MKLLILESTEHAIRQISELILGKIAKNPDLVLGLATGRTMDPLYDHMVKHSQARQISFSKITTFNLDEYVGLAPTHPCSYRYYMNMALFNRIDINLSQTFLPDGNTDNLQREAEIYEGKIEKAGGIDLQLLGIGQNGHIGFNEPISSLGSRTRIKLLTRETRQINQRYFSSLEETPQYALTMGIQTILSAHHLILLATGSSKAAAVAKMIEGPVSASCPASALQFHPNTTIFLDPEAAAQLTLPVYEREADDKATQHK